VSDFALGIDIGGTKIAVGLVNRAGTVVRRAETPTPAALGGAQIVTKALGLARELMEGVPVVAVGVGSAGVIDPITRRVIFATDHLKDWAGTELGLMLESGLGLPVSASNDVHAHAVGEAFVGAGRGHGTVLVAAVGTGIGGAVVINGVVQAGAHGVAGHFGHLPVAEAEGMLCPCGRVGHVEAISSGTALHAYYLKLGGDPGQEDALASRAVSTSGRTLGQALGGLTNVIDPDVIIIAGGMRNAGEPWWSAMEAGLRDTALPILSDVLLVKAELGDDAAIIGAAKQAFDLLEKLA
jgi:glucokinase